MIRCVDNTLYTGISTDVERRFHEHATGGKRSAKYLRGKDPLKLVFQLAVPDRGTASRIENKIKQLRKVDKESLIHNPNQQKKLLVCQDK